jgi:hypothetical protein
MASAAHSAGENLVQRKTKPIYLTPTGLLMERVYAQNPILQVNECNPSV